MECPNNKNNKSTCKVVIWNAVTLEGAVQREEIPPLLSCFKTSVKTIIGVLFVCYWPVTVADPFPSPSLCCSTLNLSPKGSAEPSFLSAALILRNKNISPISSAQNASFQPDVSTKRTFQTTCLWVYRWLLKSNKEHSLFSNWSCLKNYILARTLTALTFFL